MKTSLCRAVTFYSEDLYSLPSLLPLWKFLTSGNSEGKKVFQVF